MKLNTIDSLMSQPLRPPTPRGGYPDRSGAAHPGWLAQGGQSWLALVAM